MSYKLNKNFTIAFLALFMVINNVENLRAQGIVSLVEDENPAFEDDIFAPSENEAALTMPTEAEIDTNLPNSISEDDFIPLDNGLISPADPFEAPAASVTLSPQAASENAANADESQFIAEEPQAVEPADDAQPEEFSLGLESNNQPFGTAPIAAQEPVNNGGMGALASAPEPQPVVKEVLPQAPLQTEKFANTVLSKIDNDLFSQMSDIEKQTTLLTLELRREKIRNEIEAIKAQREKAAQERIAAEEEKKRKEIEWQKEQEAKVLREQQALKEKEIELEKLKQRKMLNAYMNQMLAQNQKWIAENTALHKQMKQIEKDRKNLADNFKTKLNNLITLSNKVSQSANDAKSNHDRTVASLTAQNIQLKKRIEADALAAKNREQNPFSEGQGANGGVSTSVDEKIVPVNLAKEYAIMEITGKGENLAARLINKEGDSFVIKKGTTLHTGHTVDEISEHYIQFDKNGLKDYLYTAGSAIGTEPQKMEGTATTQATQPAPQKQSQPLRGAEKGLPSLGSGMFVK